MALLRRLSADNGTSFAGCQQLPGIEQAREFAQFGYDPRPARLMAGP
jgi:hypothetical protein